MDNHPDLRGPVPIEIWQMPNLLNVYVTQHIDYYATPLQLILAIEDLNCLFTLDDNSQ